MRDFKKETIICTEEIFKSVNVGKYFDEKLNSTLDCQLALV